MELDNAKLENLRKAMLMIGFTEEETDKQLSELNEIITMTIIARVVKEKNGQDITPETLDSFLKENYSTDELFTMVTEESGKVVGKYLNEITSDLDEDKKKAFYEQIK